MGNRAETEDEALGFEAAVAALGLKANVSEADHPLLCEGTRRQRGELTLTLLVQYKDCSEKLARIMDKLLDRFVFVFLILSGILFKQFFYFLQRGASIDEGAPTAVVLLKQPTNNCSILPPLAGQQNWPTVPGAVGTYDGWRARRGGCCRTVAAGLHVAGARAC